MFDEAKALLFARFDRPINERITRAINITGLQEDELPSQWLARFRQTRGKCTINDLDRWALIRQIPAPPPLHPTLDAIQPPSSNDDFAKHCDRLIKTVPQPVHNISNNTTDPLNPT